MRRSPLTVILRAVAISLIAAVLTTLGVFIAAFVVFPLRDVRVSGNEMLRSSTVEDLVPNRASLLTINTPKLVSELKGDPWVEDVSVSRDWSEGELVVEVYERSAVLNAEVNGREAILSLDGKELPGMGGKDLRTIELSERQVRDTLRVSRAFDGDGASLEQIVEVDDAGIHAVVSGRNVLYTDGLKDSQVSYLPDVMEENPGAKLFDLRAGGRIVVRSDVPDGALASGSDQPKSEG